MTGTILRRLLSMVPVMVVVAICVFLLLHLAPGDPAAIIAGENVTPENIARIRAQLGLDQPVWKQFLVWIVALLHGDLGQSMFWGDDVISLIGQRAEPTISLALTTLCVAVFLAIALGVLAAARAGSWIDRLVMGFAVLGFSVPVFVVGYVLAYSFALQLDWFPVQGYTPISQGIGPWLNNLALPTIALGSAFIALLARITRATMLEVLSQDYVRTAKAKGVGQSSVLFVHGLKNAAVPIVTIIGLGFAGLIGGAVVTESVFAIPGVGRLVVDAILRRDYPVIQGVVLMFSFVYVLVNLAVDLLYTVFDPRIRY